ncbi:uncharacterized protein LOC121390007 isoform X2 [Gigantopelta aegis]|uniref:uncharacterized protein LOC121390007 isoform X2 n=1 Tax=Gigantopelta aegis TaxID=1735272 RepID=UPI001B88B573|nr:uncharacterized protein LOC121390007 isoform X2 [Gigantopelta aegis]
MAQSRKIAKRGRQPLSVEQVVVGAQATVSSAQQLVARVTAPCVRQRGRTHKSVTKPVPVHKSVEVNLYNCTNVQVGYHNMMCIQNVQRIKESSMHMLSDTDEDELTQQDDVEKESQLTNSLRTVSDDELRNLAQHVGGKWRRFVRHLGIEEADIEYAYSQYNSSGLVETVYQICLQWKRENIHPLVSTIADALKHSELKHLYEYLTP